MAGMFYSLEEVAKKLNKTEEQVKELVKTGRLREFRDGPNLLFKVDEVESLMSDTSFMSSVETPATGEPEETAGQEEISIESEADDTSASTGGPSESEEKTLAEESTAEEKTPSDESGADEEEITLASETSQETTIEGDLTSADTTLTTEGINVLGETDSDYPAAEDTQGETQAVTEEESLEEIEEDINLDSFGSGSGLLDLSLQADDTSLGGILDDIYMSEGEGKKEAAEGSAMEVAAEAEQIFSEEAPQAAPAGAVMVRRYAEPEPDTGSNLLGIMLVLPLLAVVYTVIVTVVVSNGVMPSILGKIHNIIFIILGVFLVASLVMGAAGFLVGAGGGKSAKPKAKKEKKKKKAKAEPPSSPETAPSQPE